MRRRASSLLHSVRKGSRASRSSTSDEHSIDETTVSTVESGDYSAPAEVGGNPLRLSEMDSVDDAMIAEMLQLDAGLRTSEDLLPVRDRFGLLDDAIVREHIPAVNDLESIPEATDAELSYQRLLPRLEKFGLKERKVEPDGSCQFRAVSDQLYGSEKHHALVRSRVVAELSTNPDRYQDYVPQKFSTYVKHMKKAGTWGDHVTLQAIAESYSVGIAVVHSFHSDEVIDVTPKFSKETNWLHLSFWAEVHYNSLVPNDD